jgi:tetratricopeptide (TPR) repeat protein
MKMMKKITYTIAGLFLLIATLDVNAQMEMNVQDCTVEYNLFKGDVQGKNFVEAKKRLDNLMSNCPKLSVNIYKLGAKIADDMIAKGDKVAGVALMKKTYDQRIIHFPKGLGKVYSDYANFCLENGGTDAEAMMLLEKGYNADPTGLSAKNIYKYFDNILESNKNNNVQKILDTYDDINDALEIKSGKYQQRLSKLIAKEEAGTELGKKDAKSKRIAEGTLKNIGIINGGLDQKIEELLTCERLVPLYKRDFESNRTNGQWLKRAVSRMYYKECTNDSLYEELVEAYANAEPSAASKMFYAILLEKRGKLAEASQMRKEAFELETDPIKKSNLLLKDAYDLSRKGKKSDARRQANAALKFNPSNGNAYLLIATMYARSANSCGTDLFSKRMVYVAALNKARRAAVVDPSMSQKVKKFVKSYASNIPTKQDGFAEGYKAGDSYKVGCWIGETVRVQLR